MPRTIQEVEDEVARLRDLDPVALRARWRAVTGRMAPKGASTSLLLRLLAYRVQAEAFGDLSRESARVLDAIGTGRPVPLPVRRESPGTVLVREWNGVRHHVMAVKDGFAWNGGTYRSLSEVACAITGTRWSGPRFFGIKVRPGSQDQGRAG
ncbi:DUF2924 domain-containing protein [uncultured Enterovirga sp.]|uniref:DUF2924 domain-containing protein n=1 Tax=uncultured Enterovirga sp. TaxID=2026352 RepID=UPI0035CC20A5